MLQLNGNTDPPSAGLGLLQPLLRTLANVAACGGRDAYAALLISSTSRATMLQCSWHVIHIVLVIQVLLLSIICSQRCLACAVQHVE